MAKRSYAENQKMLRARVKPSVITTETTKARGKELTEGLREVNNCGVSFKNTRERVLQCSKRPMYLNTRKVATPGDLESNRGKIPDFAAENAKLEQATTRKTAKYSGNKRTLVNSTSNPNTFDSSKNARTKSEQNEWNGGQYLTPKYKGKVKYEGYHAPTNSMSEASSHHGVKSLNPTLKELQRVSAIKPKLPKKVDSVPITTRTGEYIRTGNCTVEVALSELAKLAPKKKVKK